MSKYDKFRERVCARPTPSDIRWTELQGFLEHLGYTMRPGRGSRRKFFHPEKNALIICHQPHPHPTVDKGCVNDVVEHLKAHGLLEG